MIKVEFSTDDCLMIVSFVRFGFRQQHAKTAKVGDVSVAAEQAFGAPHKDKETAINNNALGELACLELQVNSYAIYLHIIIHIPRGK